MVMGPAVSWRERRFIWRRLVVWGVVLLVLSAGVAVLWPQRQATVRLLDARRALEAADPEQALRFLEAAERIQPNRAEVQYLLAVANRRCGRLDEFASHLQRAAELGWDPEDIERQVWLADAQQGNLGDIRQPLLEVVRTGATDETTEEIYEAFAKGCLSTYRLRDAWMCLDIWLQWRPDAPQALLMRAGLHEQLGDFEEACRDYRAVLAQRPGDREARVRLGQALAVRRRDEEALVEFQARLATASDDVDALLGAGQCARRLGQPEMARRHIQAALPLALTSHQRGSALAEWGRLLLDEGQTEQALAALSQAVAILPGNSQIHHSLGTALARAGKRDQAQYHHARMQHLREQFDRMTEITRRLMTEPANADLRCEAGAILADAGLKKESADWLLTALKYDPQHRRTHELLAEYYAEEGHQTQAGRHRLLAAQSPASPSASAVSEGNQP
jgi:tetratricopeptide (TPR) repeat protein